MLDLSQLFPDFVTHHLSPIGDHADSLQPQEKELMTTASPKREREFATGRYCARQALAPHNIHDFALLPDPQRAPIWPTDLCGSITHTRDYAAAVVAKQSDTASIGLDIENLDRVRPELWDHILTPIEQERIRSLPAKQWPEQSTLIFAAKESFYKFQYYLTGQWLGFLDAVVTPSSAHTFTIELLRPHSHFPKNSQWTGHYLKQEDTLAASIWQKNGSQQA